MDRRLTVKVTDQETSKNLYCAKCGETHEFRYSHLRLDDGKRYICFVGVECFTEHLEPVSK